MVNTTKVLVIRLSSIGDIVLTTPVVRCLKEQLHGPSELHFLVKEKFADVVRFNPHIDKIHILQDDINHTIRELELEGFHYIIDLHKNYRSIFIRRKLKVLSFTFPKLNVKKWILVNLKWDLLPDIHIVDRYFMAVKALGIQNDGKGCELFIPDEMKVAVKERLNLDPEGYIALAIGGAHDGKKLSPQQLREICAELKHPVVLLGGKEDETSGEFISDGLEHVHNQTGQLTLLQSASVIQQAKVVVCHDSGLMHIAAAFKRKIVSIWGATVPKFGMAPYLPHPASVMIEADHLTFRPTSKLGNKNTRRERRTTAEIDLTKVVEGVDSLWNNPS